MNRLLLCLLIALPVHVSAKTLVIKNESGQVEFVAIGRPAMLRIHGNGPRPSGALTLEKSLVSGTLTVPLSGLDTGIEMRDRHMKERYLETGKFPEATLILKELNVDTSSANDQNFNALLSLHGQQKPITGKIKLKDQTDAFAVDARFDLKLSDFNIDIPSYAGIKVADSVAVNVSFEVAK